MWHLPGTGGHDGAEQEAGVIIVCVCLIVVSGIRCVPPPCMSCQVFFADEGHFTVGARIWPGGEGQVGVPMRFQL